MSWQGERGTGKWGIHRRDAEDAEGQTFSRARQGALEGPGFRHG